MIRLINNKTFKTIAISLFISTVACYALLVYVHTPGKGGRFYIPEKYSGWICVSYEVDNMPPLNEEDGFLIYKIPQNGVLKTSSKPRLSPSYDEYYYCTKEGTRKAEELEMGGGYTVQTDGQKEFISYFWISSSDANKDYEKYVKDRPVMDENGFIHPVCGQWEEGKK